MKKSLNLSQLQANTYEASLKTPHPKKFPRVGKPYTPRISSYDQRRPIERQMQIDS